MRQFLFFFLRFTGSLQRAIRRIKGLTEKDVHDQRIASGKAWEEFCDQLKVAGNVLLSPGVPKDPFQQAEGVRYLTRLTRAGLEAFVEHGDPEVPELRRMVHETVKMGADNPDNYYMNAQISGKYEYKILGKRNTIDYISFHTQNGNYGTGRGMAPCSALSDADLIVEKDGSFELILSKEPKGKNWLKVEDETSLLIVRQTFLDRTREVPADLELINLSTGNKPGPLTTEQVDEGLKTASMFVGGAALLFKDWAKGFKKHINKLPQFDPGISNAAGGDDTIIYYHSYWKLEPDEILLIEVLPPVCDTWNFQLNNFWMESLDYRHFNISINKHSATYELDGTIRIVIAHTDPGLPNWIHTAGHNEGTMCWRWYRIQVGSEPVEPSCTLLKFHELKSQ